MIDGGMNRKTGRREGWGFVSPKSSRLPVFLFSLLGIAWSTDAWGAGAVETVAQELTQSLGNVPGAAVVVAAPVTSDQPAPKGDELALRVAALVAGRLGNAARPGGQTAQLATARAMSAKAGGLVYVQIEVARGDLRATADLYPVMRNAWDRIRNPLPSPTAHAFASARVDAEVRAFLVPLLLEQATLHKAVHDEGDVLAVACGDVDDDGGMEIALVSRARVSMGRVRSGKFVADKSAPWSELAPRAPVPMREPLATAAFARVTDKGRLFVGTTDRGGVALAGDFVAHALLGAYPVSLGEELGCLAVNPAAAAFEGGVADCFAGKDAPLRLESPAQRYDAFATANVVAADGTARAIVAAREPGGKLRLRLGEKTHLVEGAGAQVAVGDLDEDGVPEVALTVDAPTEDAIAVLSWNGAGDPKQRLRFSAPGGVRALAVCPPEERGAPALVAVVGHEVWIVR